MQIRPLFHSALIATVLLIPAPALAESPALALADGQAWAATMPNGDKAEITFLPDGTARAKRGFFSIRLTWTPTAEGMCMEGGPGGNRCMAIMPEARGYIGVSDDKVILVLTR